MFKKVKKIALELCIAIYLIVALAFTQHKEARVICRDMDIAIADDSENQFVEVGDVQNLIKNKGVSTIGTPLEHIDILMLEQAINNHPSVEKSQVFRCIDGRLGIDVWQRQPIVRIINNTRESYYIDKEGVMMPLSMKYTARVVVANGVLNEPYTSRYSKDLASSDTTKKRGSKLLRDIYTMSKYIHDHKFFNALIEQIYITPEKEFVLVPKIGPPIIEFGAVDETLENRFVKLRAFYDKGLSRIGWERYSKISIKYKDQVVCTKR